MRFLQELIHRVEVARGARPLKLTLAFLAAAALIVTYNLRCYRNLSTLEAMDAAQLGRNLAEGKGYTTSFIRPFSMHLLAREKRRESGLPKPGELADHSRIKGPHPDISNPPVYPVALAGLMKVLPFDYDASVTGTFWSSNGRFWRYQPDFLIAVFNQALFLALVALVFFWSRRMFDSTVAWISSALLLGTDVLWRFSVSGLSTMLLLVVFMGLVGCLTLLENRAREPGDNGFQLPALALAAGALAGIGGLTRYAFAWLIVPVVIFLVLFSGPRRPVLCLAALAGFCAIMAPWTFRNYSLSGSPFGTATYHLISGTDLPEHGLERSLNPDLQDWLGPIQAKLFPNLGGILTNDLFRIGNGWMMALFIAGLMIGFRNPAVRRMRYFLLGAAALLIVAQALGRTQLSVDSPEINSENLLVLLLPLVMVYGVAVFLLLLDQLIPHNRQLRYAATAVLVGLSSLPLVFALLAPRTSPVAYPPYHPRAIQDVSGYLKDTELMMSDIPWAVAWYGRRQCVWLTLNALPDPGDPGVGEDFSAINDYHRPIQGLYLTPKTLNGRFVAEWFQGRTSWASVLLTTIVTGEPDPEFPLRHVFGGYLPDQLFLSDMQRWPGAEPGGQE